MGVARQHRGDLMPGYFGQIGVIYTSCAKVGDVGVAALVGADI